MKPLRKPCRLGMALFAAGASVLALRSAEPAVPPVTEPTLRKDVVYGRAGGVDLKCDLVKPVTGTGPFPAIVYFHGGGWQAGNKWHGHGWIKAFASQGYVGVTVAYRFAPDFKWPSQVEDAKAVVRYLRANAAELNIDPDRIGAMGESAGGYLALMLGVTGPKDGFEGDGGNAATSSRVRAVASYFSATDFTELRKKDAKPNPESDADTFRYYKKTGAQVIAEFTGATGPDDPLLAKISVLPYVDKTDSPTIIFQGDADPVVSTDHAEKLDRAMTAAGVRHELVIVAGGGHGWKGALRDSTNLQLARFFEQELKGKK